MPSGIRSRVEGADFLTGVDPVWAGLHDHEQIKDGRSYRDTWHVVYPDRDRPTVVMPTLERSHALWYQLGGIVHELGHVLDAATGFRHNAVPITGYAAGNRREAFAESLVAWLFEKRDHRWLLPWFWDGDSARLHDDGQSIAFFDALA